MFVALRAFLPRGAVFREMVIDPGHFGQPPGAGWFARPGDTLAG